MNGPTLPVLAFATLAAVGGLACVFAAAPDAEQGAAAPAGAAVVVELFTSQGCSSCPPADRLLSELADDPDLAGRVLPLSFHVDYWDHIGWKDPFSSPRWSARQRGYAEVLDGRVYTPEVVVAGRRGMVGSRRGEVKEAVREALAAPPAAVVAIELGAAADGRLAVTASARILSAGDGGQQLWVALWQDGLVTEVGRGENGGRTLLNDRVVRWLVRAAELPGTVGATAEGRAVLHLDAAWPRRDLGVVAFVQDADRGAIHGAAGVRLASASTAGAR